MDYVRIRPLPFGWQLESRLNPAPMVFRTGGAAEREGRRHAKLIANDGSSVTLLVSDLSGTIIASQVL